MNIDRYKNDIDRLVSAGEGLYASLVLEMHAKQHKEFGLTQEQAKKLPNFHEGYQAWYSESLKCIAQLMPERQEDFRAYYQAPRVRKEITHANYTIQDYLRSLTVTFAGSKVVEPSAAIPVMVQQLMMVKAIRQRFESSLFDIRALVQADLFDDELHAAEDLNRKGFHRGAGAMAGVVLEGHLATVCDLHRIKIPATSSISKLNDSLKSNGVIDLATWRFIQHLGDLRNSCDHKTASDPTLVHVKELLEGTRKIYKDDLLSFPLLH